jgi:hypothetical protein
MALTTYMSYLKHICQSLGKANPNNLVGIGEQCLSVHRNIFVDKKYLSSIIAIAPVDQPNTDFDSIYLLIVQKGQGQYVQFDCLLHIEVCGL